MINQKEEPKKSKLMASFDSNNLLIVVPFLALLGIALLVGYLLLGVGVSAAVLVVAGSLTQQTNWLFALPAALILNGLYHNAVTTKWTNYLLVYSLAVRNSQARWVDDYVGTINENLLDKYSSAVVQTFSPSRNLTETTVWNKKRTSWSGKSTVVSTPGKLSKPREWKNIYKYEGRNDDSPSNFINGEFFRDAGPYQESALEARHVSACKARRSFLWAKYSAALVAGLSLISFLVQGF